MISVVALYTQVCRHRHHGLFGTAMTQWLGLTCNEMRLFGAEGAWIAQSGGFLAVVREPNSEPMRSSLRADAWVGTALEDVKAQARSVEQRRARRERGACIGWLAKCWNHGAYVLSFILEALDLSSPSAVRLGRRIAYLLVHFAYM